MPHFQFVQASKVRQMLQSVTFGGSSNLEHICAYAFSRTCVVSLSIPDNVVELYKKCFQSVRVCGVSHLVHYLSLSVSVPMHSMVQVLSHFLFRTVSLNSSVRFYYRCYHFLVRRSAVKSLTRLDIATAPLSSLMVMFCESHSTPPTRSAFSTVYCASA